MESSQIEDSEDNNNHRGVSFKKISSKNEMKMKFFKMMNKKKSLGNKANNRPNPEQRFSKKKTESREKVVPEKSKPQSRPTSYLFQSSVNVENFKTQELQKTGKKSKIEIIPDSSIDKSIMTQNSSSYLANADCISISNQLKSKLVNEKPQIMFAQSVQSQEFQCNQPSSFVTKEDCQQNSQYKMPYRDTLKQIDCMTKISSEFPKKMLKIDLKNKKTGIGQRRNFRQKVQQDSCSQHSPTSSQLRKSQFYKSSSQSHLKKVNQSIGRSKNIFLKKSKESGGEHPPKRMKSLKFEQTSNSEQMNSQYQHHHMNQSYQIPFKKEASIKAPYYRTMTSKHRACQFKNFDQPNLDFEKFENIFKLSDKIKQTTEFEKSKRIVNSKFGFDATDRLFQISKKNQIKRSQKIKESLKRKLETDLQACTFTPQINSFPLKYLKKLNIIKNAENKTDNESFLNKTKYSAIENKTGGQKTDRTIVKSTKKVKKTFLSQQNKKRSSSGTFSNHQSTEFNKKKNLASRNCKLLSQFCNNSIERKRSEKKERKFRSTHNLRESSMKKSSTDFDFKKSKFFRKIIEPQTSKTPESDLFEFKEIFTDKKLNNQKTMNTLDQNVTLINRHSENSKLQDYKRELKFQRHQSSFCLTGRKSELIELGDFTNKKHQPDNYSFQIIKTNSFNKNKEFRSQMTVAGFPKDSQSSDSFNLQANLNVINIQPSRNQTMTSFNKENEKTQLNRDYRHFLAEPKA